MKAPDVLATLALELNRHRVSNTTDFIQKGWCHKSQSTPSNSIGGEAHRPPCERDGKIISTSSAEFSDVKTLNVVTRSKAGLQEIASA